MEEWLLFDRIDIERNGTLVHERIQRAILILPHTAEATFRGRDGAPMMTQMTSNPSLPQRGIQQCFLHITSFEPLTTRDFHGLDEIETGHHPILNILGMVNTKNTSELHLSDSTG